jgi:hypothetical protein
MSGSYASPASGYIFFDGKTMFGYDVKKIILFKTNVGAFYIFVHKEIMGIFVGKNECCSGAW